MVGHLKTIQFRIVKLIKMKFKFSCIKKILKLNNFKKQLKIFNLLILIYKIKLINNHKVKKVMMLKLLRNFNKKLIK